MSWQTKSVMEQRLLFIKMLQSGNYTTTALCDLFNISRTTGHKLVKRFEQEGERCLGIKSKVSINSPQKTPKKMELSSHVVSRIFDYF